MTLADLATHKLVRPLTATASGFWQRLRAYVPNSLAFRLFAASVLWLLIVLPMADWLLYSLYRQDIETTFDKRLADANLALIDSANDSARGNNGIVIGPIVLDDPIYSSPLSGNYWLLEPIEGTAGQRLTSSSLLDGNLTMPETAQQPAGRPYRIADSVGPEKGAIRMLEREYRFTSGNTVRRYRVLVTGNLAEIEFNVARFHTRLYSAFAVLAIGMILTMALGIRYGLQPLGAIKTALTDIRSGRATRLEGHFPNEIVPLQTELNALIQSNEDIIERARTHVGNLAHALKTPLSVITNEAIDDQNPLARKVAEQAKIMRDQVQHHLDRARMVARVGGIGAMVEVQPVSAALVRTLNRIYGERGLTVSATCPAGLNFQGEKQDLEEMLGNLMDNACKWAGSEIELTVSALPGKDKREQRWLEMIIDDDGPGLTEEQRIAARKRGKRLDETKPGSGLGMAIVGDLVELYKGRFELAASPKGGLRAILTLPAT